MEHSHDPIPREDFLETEGPDGSGLVTQRFLAFNTVVTLLAFGDERACLTAFDRARADARRFERLFSRTLPHSDIARLNAAGGAPVEIEGDTADLLRRALAFCADSAIIPPKAALREAITHVDWRGVRVWAEDDRAFAQLNDAHAALDLGGIAKGWIADALADTLAEGGLARFLINLGGNVVARGEKPGGIPWNVGIRDPRRADGIVGSTPLHDASAVTSGIYERCCEVDGTLYHHILSPKTGMPAQTDVAGVTVIADRSIDAEGYSTTLLALGTSRGIAFAREHPVIRKAIFATRDGDVIES